jgi:hypothetical protein
VAPQTAARERRIRVEAKHLSNSDLLKLNVTEFSKAPYDFETAFADGAKAKVEAYIELASPVLASSTRQLAALLQKIPSAWGSGSRRPSGGWRAGELRPRSWEGRKAGG